MNKDRKTNDMSMWEAYADLQDGIYHLHDLPPLVNTPYPCFSIADISETVLKLAPDTYQVELLSIQNEFLKIQKDSMNSGFTFISIDSRIINTKVTQKVEEIAKNNSDTGIINMDRYICEACNGDQFFRLNVSRGENDGLVARPNITETPEQQLDSLSDWAKTNNYTKLLLVDDVLAYGGTMSYIIKEVQRRLPYCDVNVLVGVAASGGKWSGIEKLKEVTGIEATYLTKIIASVENNWSTGMSIPVSRDMTIFGGKVGTHKDSGLQTIYPYFLPFSKPKKATLASDIDGAERSLRLIEFSKKIVTLIDKNKSKPLTTGDLVKEGIGLPFTNLKSLKNKIDIPMANTPVIDYIEYTRRVLLDNLDAVTEEIKA